MLVSVLFAFCLALLAGRRGQLGHLLKVAGFLAGELLKRAANRQHLMYAFRTCRHVLITVTQKAEAMRNADISFCNADACGLDQLGIWGSPVMMVLMGFRKC